MLLVLIIISSLSSLSSSVLLRTVATRGCRWVTIAVPGRRRPRMLKITMTSKRSWERKCSNSPSLAVGNTATICMKTEGFYNDAFNFFQMDIIQSPLHAVIFLKMYLRLVMCIEQVLGCYWPPPHESEHNIFLCVTNVVQVARGVCVNYQCKATLSKCQQVLLLSGHFHNSAFCQGIGYRGQWCECRLSDTVQFGIRFGMKLYVHRTLSYLRQTARQPHSILVIFWPYCNICLTLLS